ncbi:unnamed protein product [Dicrocoelium dendriticum]|nr:unnamed protein product [Dicrocoelium dendriticum]
MYVFVRTRAVHFFPHFRSCRRYLRPYFLGSSSSRLIYDIITHVCALFCLNYLGIAFLLLKAHHVVYFWRQMRFLGHIVPLLLIIFLPLICSKPTETSELDPSPISVRKTIKLHETIQPSEKSISSHLH